VPLERFAIRLKKRRIANQAIRIETTAVLERKEFCDAAWPSKELKRKERNSYCPLIAPEKSAVKRHKLYFSKNVYSNISVEILSHSA
jgi:hypothetical protein